MRFVEFNIVISIKRIVLKQNNVNKYTALWKHWQLNGYVGIRLVSILLILK